MHYRFRLPSLKPHALSFPSYEMFQANVQAAVDQANLLSGVRNDIEFVFSHHLFQTRSVC